jgi:ankyrin repeat protein
MSSSSSDNDNDEGSDCDEESSSEDEESSSEDEEADLDLIETVRLDDAEGVQYYLRNGANVNCKTGIGRYEATPLYWASYHGNDGIVRILLDAGADPWDRDSLDLSAIDIACLRGHLAIVEMLLNHDNGLIEIENNTEHTPLLRAIENGLFEIVRFWLDRGANALATTYDGSTALMLACQEEPDPNLEIVRLLLAAGVPVDARDRTRRTALHYAAHSSSIDLVRELIIEHNADMFAVDKDGDTPFDWTIHEYSTERIHVFLIEQYSNKLTQEHGRLALHAVLGAAEYSVIEEFFFHPPLNPLRIRLPPLGVLILPHFWTLLHHLDVELVRHRDASGKLPIHIACQNKAPVEVLALIAEQDAATLQMADYMGTLPLHDLCCGAIDDSSVRCLVEHGGVGTLAARNRDGALPLHLLCGSQNPTLRTVQYMVQSFAGSLATRTNADQYPFMIAACDSSTASLSVVYELVRVNPDLVIPH